MYDSVSSLTQLALKKIEGAVNNQIFPNMTEYGFLLFLTSKVEG
jgi:hypothetical protein